LEVFSTDSYSDLRQAEDLENIVDNLKEDCVSSHVERLMTKSCEPFGGVIYSDFITDLERCADHAINVAFSLSGREEEDVSA
jgi:phosphate:Na+ symporter